VDCVINLIGILNQAHPRYQKFRTAHVQLAEIVIEACKAAGVKRLLHMSALQADEKAPSAYLRTKARAEKLVHASADKVNVTSFRPAVIFGPRDSFLNRFSALLDQVPLLFPLACGDSLMQPIYVEDVARCFVQSMNDFRTFGQRYELCGPHTYSLKEIVEYVARLKCKHTRIVTLGSFASRLQAQILQMMPGTPFSVDNYRSLQVDSVCRQGFPNIFGIQPTPMEDIAPGYISPDYCDPYAGYRRKHYRE
jgi:NADH dehydrogenase